MSLTLNLKSHDMKVDAHAQSCFSLVANFKIKHGKGQAPTPTHSTQENNQHADTGAIPAVSSHMNAYPGTIRTNTLISLRQKKECILAINGRQDILKQAKKIVLRLMLLLLLGFNCWCRRCWRHGLSKSKTSSSWYRRSRAKGYGGRWR